MGPTASNREDVAANTSYLLLWASGKLHFRYFDQRGGLVIWPDKVTVHLGFKHKNLPPIQERLDVIGWEREVELNCNQEGQEWDFDTIRP